MPTPADLPADPHLWLEEVLGDEQLAWVRDQNARTDAELAGDDEFAALAAGIRGVLDADDNIPFVSKVGDHLYNFWQDASHERGLWRRTTMASYRSGATEWEVLLDLDALSAEEGENWVWHGAGLLRPSLDRALVSLSRGGADADVTRELDLTTLTWVDGGFERPEAKGDVSWVDRDRVLVSTDFGDGSMTESGYPRLVKEWRRGTPMTEAPTVFEARREDMGVWAWHDSTPGFERDLVHRQIGFFTSETFLLGEDRQATLIESPDSADVSLHREWLLLRLRDDWDLGGTTYTSGSLLAARLVDWLAGDRRVQVLFEPTEASSLEAATFTRHRLVLNVLEHVRHKLSVLVPPADGGTGWTHEPFTGAPELGTVSIGALDARESDDLWMTVTDFLTPTTLSLVPATDEGYGEPEVLRSAPAFFDAGTHVIEQHFATSDDGTRVPYFLVRPQDLAFDGTAPTILYGYGGFEVSRVPAYSGMLGRGWLERGGVYAVANIRGGGEYGPRWHRAALRESRHKAYEDFAAVARDLADRKVTSAEHLAGMGGSNGGLLVGNMLVSYPDLFGALVIQVPLLDMARYHLLLAGASWVAEYGDPENPEDWAFLQRWSPYQLLDETRTYPPTFIWTTTRDDRVHPGHARKMAAKMLAAGADVRYFENTEGGHGAGATNAQTAHTHALSYRFLWNTLR
ncbi:MAG: prolyl oligopeptidase family serine peptidase [Nocardioides sp.]